MFFWGGRRSSLDLFGLTTFGCALIQSNMFGGGTRCSACSTPDFSALRRPGSNLRTSSFFFTATNKSLQTRHATHGEFAKKVWAHAPRTTDIALKHSFGFGGCFSVLHLSKAGRIARCLESTHGSAPCADALCKSPFGGDCQYVER